MGAGGVVIAADILIRTDVRAIIASIEGLSRLAVSSG
jgi:hypothetical protein